MTAVPFNPFVTYTDTSGNPLVGGKIYTYAAGTTTPLATYTDASGSVNATNPIILDAAGRSPYGAIWGSGVYKFVLKDSTDATIQTDDNITAAFGAGDMTKAVYDAANISQQVVGTTAVQTVTNKTITTTASSTSAAGFNLPHGAAPTSPVNGDLWTTTSGAYARINGSTVNLGGGVFSLSYTSTDQTITSGGSLVLAHSLGAAPKFTAFELVCQSSEGGYSNGNVVPIWPQGAQGNITGGSAAPGVSVITDATNITLRYGSAVAAFQIVNASTGNAFNITNSNWKLRVKAWA